MSAFAQSTVTVTGIMDAGYYTGKLYGQAFNVVNNNGARTTAIKFIGSEDLGGGLKANFQFEVDPSLTANDKNLFSNTTFNGAAGSAAPTVSAANAGSQAANANTAAAQPGLVGAGYSYVGLSGGFGEFQFGTINTATLTAFTTGSQMFGTAVGSGYGSGLYSKFTRYENSMMYSTPTINGFKARVLFAPGNDSQYGSAVAGVTLRRTQNNEIAASYANGPLAATGAQIRTVSTPNEATGKANITTTINTLGAAYDLQVAKVSFGYQSVKADGTDQGQNTDTVANNVMVQFPLNSVTRLAVNYGRLTSNQVAAPTTYLVAGTNKFTAVGVQYDLSKNTFLYGTYEKAAMGAVDFAGTIVNGVVGSTSTSNARNVTVVGISSAF